MNLDASFFLELAGKVWAAHHLSWWFHIEKEDAIQEAVMDCWKLRGTWRPGISKATSYFSMIARQSMTRANARERRQRRWYSLTMDAPSVVRPKETMGDSAAYGGPGPEELADLELTAQLVIEAVRSLPERLRLVSLSIMGGEKSRELADRLGISRQRADQLRARTLASLRRRLSGAMDLTNAPPCGIIRS